MAQFTFYTNPMSRGQIVRWALHEAGADYDQVLLSYGGTMIGDDYRAINPMGKVPALVHHHGDHDHVVTECAAINHYLAEVHPDAGLLPDSHERAAYFRWLFFGAGPLEQAVIANAMGWQVSDEQQVMAGFGSFERTLDALGSWFESHDFVAGDRFTMADTYVGSQFIWGLQFGTIPERPAFRAYVDRLIQRSAYVEAKAIDAKLIEAAEAG
ncbi:MAG: glutathione S-transferase family protein [Erythrobacter sp.]|jgi:glutathione S-transferase|nr:glutathione S-transferase family protein [Erythrobacter sp.]